MALLCSWISANLANYANVFIVAFTGKLKYPPKMHCHPSPQPTTRRPAISSTPRIPPSSSRNTKRPSSGNKRPPARKPASDDGKGGRRHSKEFLARSIIIPRYKHKVYFVDTLFSLTTCWWQQHLWGGIEQSAKCVLGGIRHPTDFLAKSILYFKKVTKAQRVPKILFVDAFVSLTTRSWRH